MVTSEKYDDLSLFFRTTIDYLFLILEWNSQIRINISNIESASIKKITNCREKNQNGWLINISVK